jgi:hypothetical protein
MDAWADSLQETLAEVWRRLSRGAADRRAPARHPVLATAGRDGGAEARILVLRGADRDGARIELHTDRLSGKAAELAADPRAALLVWDAEARLQIRLRLRAAMRTGADAAQAWARVPESARLQYGGMPPGTPIAAPGEDRPAAEAGRFAVLDCRVDEIETLVLGEDRHRRALFRRAEGWAGQWLAP